MQKITPFLWFEKNCEEAVNFYIDVFMNSPHKSKDSKVINIIRYEKGMDAPGMPEMEGKVITAVFELNGERFMALDGGPVFKFNESISFLVDCEDQEEVDYFWEKLSAHPENEQCGWLKDKFGVSWQIIPREMGEILGNEDRKKAMRATNAMLQMKKIDIQKLRDAFHGN